MKAKYGIDSMPETAENVAADFHVARADQDAFALRSQQRAAAAIAAGRLGAGDRPGRPSPRRKAIRSCSDQDEHPRATTLEALAKLKGVVRPDGTVTAGNASGVNDGACAAAARVRSRGEAPWTHAARARDRDGDRRRGAAHHGLRPGARDAQGAGQGRI